jgi:uncharacterized protein (DUF1499 family)
MRIFMHLFIWPLIIVVALAVLVVVAGQSSWLRGTPPADLGVHNGKLKPPSATPNSVSSQAALYPDHPQHQYAGIAPLAVQGARPRWRGSR